MELSRFLKQNKVKKVSTMMVVTKSLIDDKGKPLQWKIKPISTRENEHIRESCTREVQVTGKPNLFRPKLDTNKYISLLMASSVEFPNLYDATLQDSYGVKTPEELIKEMIDDPGEYQELASFIQEFNGFTSSLQDKVDEAKN